MATFRFRAHFKHDEVDDFIKTLIYADYLNVSQAYFVILERINYPEFKKQLWKFRSQLFGLMAFF